MTKLMAVLALLGALLLGVAVLALMIMFLFGVDAWIGNIVMATLMSSVLLLFLSVGVMALVKIIRD